MKIMVSERHARAIRYALGKIRESSLSGYVSAVYLFGSCARGEAGYGSDVDLMLELLPEARAKLDFSTEVFRLKGNVSEGRRGTADADLKVVVGTGWKTDNTLFFKKVREEGKNVWA